MALILTTPAASGIKTYKNGVKIFRLHEWLGPARGTLTTLSDSLSVCGTIVKDTQTVSYSGSDPNKTIETNMGTSASDTIRIHENDLNLNSDFHYNLYIGVRCEGDIDVTKQNSTHNFLRTGSNAASVKAYASNAAFTSRFVVGSTPHAPKSATNPHYKVLDMETTISIGTFTEGFEWLLLRAATGTGGSSFAWRMDVLYLVPILANDVTPPLGPYEDYHFRQVLPDDRFDPIYNMDTATYDATRDNDPISWAGQYSVMFDAPVGFIGGTDGACADFQEGEDERTIYDANGRFLPATGEWDNDPSADLVIVAGSHYVPSQTIDTDSFTRTTPEALNQYLGASSQNRAWMIEHEIDVGGNIWCNGSQMVFDRGLYDTIFEPLGDKYDFPWSGNPYDRGHPVGVSLGGTASEIGVGGTSLGHQLFTDMQHCTMEIKVATDHILVAGFQMAFGLKNGNDTEYMCVVLDIASQGTFGLRSSAAMNAYLMYYPAPTAHRPTLTSDLLDQEVIDGPVSVTSSYTANTFVRLKIEMNWHYYKAKAWLDGSSEPGSWQLEGFMPAGYQNSTPYPMYLYPWSSATEHGSLRREKQFLFPVLMSRYFRPIEDTLGQDAEFSGNPVRQTSTYWDDLNITYEPYGSSPSDIHMRMKKYDDSINYGTAIIPWESQRLIIAPSGRYIWDNDTHGVDLSLWKEAGAPDTQAAVIHHLKQKQTLGGPIHLDLRFRPYEANDFN